jgi:molybdenum cofactor cytidylyltransferase
MPAIAPATIDDLAAMLAAPDAARDSIVAPFFQGQRGHPVGVGPAHGAALAQLDGDEGARSLLAAFPIRRLDTLDAGVIRDIDTPRDLNALGDALAAP